jgi:hypothetical protein
LLQLQCTACERPPALLNAASGKSKQENQARQLQANETANYYHRAIGRSLHQRAAMVFNNFGVTL